jgi:site-specific recombinase XerD
VPAIDEPFKGEMVMPLSGKGSSNEVRTLLDEYEQFLVGNASGTSRACVRIVQHLIGWIVQFPGNEGQFQPQQLTKAVIELYLAHLAQEGFNLAHRERVKAVISNFVQFLSEEKKLLLSDPSWDNELYGSYK